MPNKYLDTESLRAIKTYVEGSFSDLNIHNGSPVGTLEQKLIIGSNNASPIASGKGAVAFGGKRIDKIEDDGTETDEDPLVPTEASGDQSFACGGGNLASGLFSAVFNKGNTASGRSSAVIGGEGCTASGQDSLATGEVTTASGRGSFSSGNTTVASGLYTVAHGYGTIADKDWCTVVGSYNDNSVTNTLFVVGNGTASNAKSNAFIVLKNGSAQVKTQGTDGKSVVIKESVTTDLRSGSGSRSVIQLHGSSANTASGQSAIALGMGNSASATRAVAIGEGAAVPNKPRAVVGVFLQQNVVHAVAVEVARADDGEACGEGVEIGPRHGAVALGEPASGEACVVLEDNVVSSVAVEVADGGDLPFVAEALEVVPARLFAAGEEAPHRAVDVAEEKIRLAVAVEVAEAEDLGIAVELAHGLPARNAAGVVGDPRADDVARASHVDVIG